MKKTLLSVIIIGLTFIVSGQNPTLPIEVQTAFSKKFSSVQELKWEREDNEWEAEFKLNGTEMSASFDNLGKWLGTETKLQKKDVPAYVFKSINLKFDGWEIEEIERIEKPDFKGYEITLEKKETETEILVTDTGELTIKKLKVEDDEDDKD